MATTKPNALVLGGTGFIGRNLVQYLMNNNLCNFVRVVDKVFPQTACLGAAHDFYTKLPAGLEFKQGNLTNEKSINACFTMADGGKFNYVFNCSAETKYGQEEAIYMEKTHDSTMKIAKEALAQKVDKFIQLSTAQVYEAGKKASKEGDKLSPWTTLAKVTLKTEESLKGLAGLPLIILRPAVVYGPGDVSGIAPRIIVAAVYKHLNEKMKLLWTGEVKLNTVHVRDVAKAMWFAATTLPVGALYNLADDNDTDQESVNKLLEQIFTIKTGFAGSLMSNMAKMNFKSITEDVNDKHLKPWSELCKQANIVNTPLTPYLDQELLYNNSLSVDGNAITKAGFKYDHPKMTIELMREQIAYHVDQKLFPTL